MAKDKAHTCLICEKPGGTGATSILRWLGYPLDGLASAYAHQECVKAKRKARREALAKVPGSPKAPAQGPKAGKSGTPAPDTPSAAPEPSVRTLPAKPPLPGKHNGWTLSWRDYPDGYVIEATKKKETIIIPNISRIRDILGASK